MSELVFATGLTEIKNAFKGAVADPDLIELLYDAVTIPVSLVNSNGSAITVAKGTASKIMNREKGGNPLCLIRDFSNDKRVTNSIVGYFRNSIIPRFLDGMDDEVIFHLRGVIKADKQISDSRKYELLKLGQKHTLAEFLANVFLYSLTRDNVMMHDAKADNAEKAEDYKRHPPESLEIPDDVVIEEQKYVQALAAVYGELMQIDNFDISLLPQYEDYN